MILGSAELNFFSSIQEAAASPMLTTISSISPQYGITSNGSSFICIHSSNSFFPGKFSEKYWSSDVFNRNIIGFAVNNPKLFSVSIFWLVGEWVRRRGDGL